MGFIWAPCGLHVRMILPASSCNDWLHGLTIESSFELDGKLMPLDLTPFETHPFIITDAQLAALQQRSLATTLVLAN